MTAVYILENTLPAVMGIVHVTCLLTFLHHTLQCFFFSSYPKTHFWGQQAVALVVVLVQASTPWMLLRQG